jgi:methylamine dehydrogenase accessory protein MauD
MAMVSCRATSPEGIRMSGWWLGSYIALWLLVAVLALLVIALARQVGTLQLRLGPRGALEVDDEGPPLGEAPEPVATSDLDGRAITVGGPGEPQLLLFVSPGCPVCREVLPAVRAVSRAGRLTPYLIGDGDRSALREAYQATGAPVAATPELVRAYAIPGTPYAVVLDHLGVVRAKGTVNNLEQLEGLVDTARRRVETAIPR